MTSEGLGGKIHTRTLHQFCVGVGLCQADGQNWRRPRAVSDFFFRVSLNREAVAVQARE